MEKAKIFVNYRRQDSEQYVFGLGLLLDDRYPGQVFWDRDSIKPGSKFRDEIEATLQQCATVIAVVGPSWLKAKDESGQQRLFNPKDVLRQELKIALERNIPIIPVLVGDAHMPQREDLPEDLQSLTEWNAMRLYLDDAKGSRARLFKVIDELLARDERKREHATVSPHRQSEIQGQTEIARKMEVSEEVRSTALPMSSAQSDSGPSAMQLRDPSEVGSRNLPSELPKKKAQTSLMADGSPVDRILRAITYAMFGLLLLVGAFFAYKVLRPYVFKPDPSVQQMEEVRRLGEKLALPGTTSSRFTRRGAVIDDSETGLSWAAQDSAQLSNISNPPVDTRWSMTHSKAAELLAVNYNRKRYGGYSDWRIPTTAEMETLCNTEDDRKKSEAEFGVPQYYYWTLENGSTNKVVALTFYTVVIATAPGNEPALRPVRGRLLVTKEH